MTKPKFGAIPDDKPVKIKLELRYRPVFIAILSPMSKRSRGRLARSTNR